MNSGPAVDGACLVVSATAGRGATVDILEGAREQAGANATGRGMLIGGSEGRCDG